MHIPPIALGKPIAQRIMHTTCGKTVTITVGAPVFVGDGWDWACPFRIDGLPEVIEKASFGIDALQSLQLVSLAIRGALAMSKEQFQDHEFNGKLISWESGFPLLIDSFGDRALERKICQNIEETLAEWVPTRK
jgi:hypothetical protein